MTVKPLSVEEFKNHCSEELKQVTTGNVSIQLTDHGQVVTTVDPVHTVLSEIARSVLGAESSVALSAISLWEVARAQKLTALTNTSEPSARMLRRAEAPSLIGSMQNQRNAWVSSNSVMTPETRDQ